MTTIYFGQVPTEFADNDEYFAEEGVKFYFKLEYYADEEFRFARLYDTAGRMVPVDADHFYHISEAFATLSNLEEIVASAQKDIAEVNNATYGIM